MIGLAQQGTSSLLAPTSLDEILVDIVGFFMESHIADLDDSIDDFHLLFDEANTSLVVEGSL